MITGSSSWKQAGLRSSHNRSKSTGSNEHIRPDHSPKHSKKANVVHSCSSTVVDPSSSRRLDQCSDSNSPNRSDLDPNCNKMGCAVHSRNRSPADRCSTADHSPIDSNNRNHSGPYPSHNNCCCLVGSMAEDCSVEDNTEEDCLAADAADSSAAECDAVVEVVAAADDEHPEEPEQFRSKPCLRQQIQPSSPMRSRRRSMFSNESPF